MDSYKVPPVRRPKRMRLQKNGRTGRMEMVIEYGSYAVVLTYEEVKAEAERRAAGKGLGQ